MEASAVEEGFAGVIALVVVTWPALFASATASATFEGCESWLAVDDPLEFVGPSMPAAGLMKLELPGAELATAGFTVLDGFIALDGGSVGLLTDGLPGIGIGALEFVLLAITLLTGLLTALSVVGTDIAGSGAAKEVTEPSDNRTETGFEGGEVAATVAAAVGAGTEALVGGGGAGSAAAVDSILSIGFPSLTAWSVR
jgi:hypothetical protein